MKRPYAHYTSEQLKAKEDEWREKLAKATNSDMRDVARYILQDVQAEIVARGTKYWQAS